jgi:uncharacterized RDD family membrane protein YckC
MHRSPLRTFRPVTAGRISALTGVPLASFWSRAAAFLIDMMFVIPIAGVIQVLEDLHKVLAPSGADVNIVINPFHGWSIAGLVLYFALTLYWGKGRTVGKRIMGIRVVSLMHEHISFWHAIERALGYGASMLEGGFGFVQYFIHPNRQTVHDRIAETIVVKEQRKPRETQAELA